MSQMLSKRNTIQMLYNSTSVGGLSCLLISIVLIGCSPQSVPEVQQSAYKDVHTIQKTSVLVAAAANLKFAFDEMETAFERQHPDVDVVATYGSSGNLFAQLSQKAPFDIFFSADTKYPQQLIADGLALNESYFPYASGRIVVWIPKGSSLDLDTLKIQAVIDLSVKKLAISNPRLAPYGLAAEEALKSFGVYDQAKDRLVLGENITQTAHFVDSGAADIGILALSLVLSPELSQKGRFWQIPAEAHSPVDQAAVIPIHSRNPDAASRLREFVIGPEGRSILARFGYFHPKD